MLIKSGTITQGSGSLGGMTMSHNRGGLYLRARTIPTDPNTTRQQVARAAFTNVVQGWTMMSDVDRSGWNVWAANTPFVNALGDPLLLTGQQAFVYANQIRTQAQALGLSDISPVDSAPVIFNTGEAVVSVDRFQTDAGNLELDATLGAPASDGGYALLFLGRPQNPSKVFFKGPYRLSAIADVTEASAAVAFVTDFSAPTEWQGSPQPAAGEFVPVKIVIAYNDGRLSQEFRSIQLVGTLT